MPGPPRRKTKQPRPLVEWEDDPSRPQIGLTLGARIRLARKRAGFGAQNLAKRVGMDTRELRRLEANESAPKPGVLERIAFAVGVPLSNLVLPSRLPARASGYAIQPHVTLDDED